ncbi:MAG: TIGR03545 family protein, partial [Elusimicrobiota bacterium]
MIKKGNLIFTLVLAAGLAVFFFFFLDPILKFAIVKGGEAVFGGRVDLVSIKTQLLKGRVVLRGLAVANQDEPMTNLLEISEADFQLSPKPLLEKKIVIQEASVKGLASGTPRKTSGELPKKNKTIESKSEQPSFLASKLEEMGGKTKSLGLEKLDALKGAGGAGAESVKSENLSSLKVLEEGRLKMDSLSSGWDSKMVQLKADLDTEALAKQLDELKGPGSDPQEIVAKIKKLKDLQEDIRRRQKNIKETKGQIEGDVEMIKKLIAQAKEAKAKDLAALKDLAGLPSLDAQNIAMYLLGPAMAKKMGTATRGFALAKKYMPKGKANKANDAKEAKEARKVAPRP